MMRTLYSRTLLGAVIATIWPAALALGPTGALAADLAFGLGVDYPTGRGSQSIATGDFDRDGIPDLVTANSDDLSVSVLRFRFNGTLRDRRDFPVQGSSSQTGIAVADVNRDGRPDVVVSACCWSVFVLLGDGEGLLGEAIEYPIARFTYPGAVAVADLNRDGRSDVVTANATNSVSVLLATEGDSFEPPVQYPTGLDQGAIEGLVLGDMNHNGKPDVITANGFDNTISVHSTKWDGSLKPKRDHPTARFPRSLALGDINHDGDADLVVGAADGITVLIGDGNLGFRARTDYPSDNLRGIALSDLDSDGHLDIAIANQVYGDTILVARGVGDGTFMSVIGYSGPAEPFGPYGLVVVDLNRDSRPDIATVQEDFVRVLLNKTPR